MVKRKRKHVTLDPLLGLELEKRWSQHMVKHGRVGFGHFCDKVIEAGFAVLDYSNAHGADIETISVEKWPPPPESDAIEKFARTVSDRFLAGAGHDSGTD